MWETSELISLQPQTNQCIENFQKIEQIKTLTMGDRRALGMECM